MATLLTLDVSGAFDNTAHQRLIHNLRKRQVPLRIVNWIASFLCHRTTEIVLMEGAMGQISTNTGIPQGSPLSPILYLFYNADLIDWIHTAYPGRAMVTGYIDDICILVWSRSAKPPRELSTPAVEGTLEGTIAAISGYAKGRNISSHSDANREGRVGQLSWHLWCYGVN